MKRLMLLEATIAISILAEGSQTGRRIARPLDDTFPGDSSFTDHLLLLPEEDRDTTIFSVVGTAPPVFADNGSRSRIDSQQGQIWSDIFLRYPSATLVASVSKLVNTLFIRIDDIADYEHFWLGDVDGIQSVRPHVNFGLDDLNVTVEHIQGFAARQDFCATGRGVKIAVLDSGVDYTHRQLGGPGTVQAFESAYGTRLDSRRNRQRDGRFPTARVYDGFDFVGDNYEVGLNGFPDDDPIDGPDFGHGTFVTSNILAVAPDAEIMALKVCSTNFRGGCPEFALLQALEYAVDPNDNDRFGDAVDIINLSLGISSLSAFYQTFSSAVELAIERGVLVVISAGNAGNLPYITGGAAISPNALSVGATGHTNERVESYSSRGPGEVHDLKPDISAPSRSAAAVSGSGNGYRVVAGTSFSCPIVAAAAALLKEKCPDCSPFAIKAILMNNANPEIFTSDGRRRAPLTLMGSGEIRVRDALAADFWAYTPSPNNVQPSISLGIINADDNMIISRRLRVRSLVDRTDTLDLTAQFIDSDDEASKAVTISFSSTSMQLGGCSNGEEVNVFFIIDASKAPLNSLSSRRDPDSLDRNEFGGHIRIRSKSSAKSIVVPFHMVLRKAANVLQSRTGFLPSNQDAYTFNVNLENIGKGVANVDAFQLLALSDDDREGDFGGSDAPADIRALGYRSYEVNEPGCTQMLEFLVTFWERQRHLVPVRIVLEIAFRNKYSVLSAGTTDLKNDESIVILGDGIRCTGFPSDHGGGSSNVVVRACNEHLSMDEDESFSVRVSTANFPNSGSFADETEWVTAELPHTVFTAEPTNIPAGTDKDVTISYERPRRDGSEELGVILMTNGYRTDTNTGASTAESETLFIVRPGVSVPSEQTVDRLDLRDAENVEGPVCRWQEGACNPLPPAGVSAPQPIGRLTDFPTREPIDPPEPTQEPSASPSCPPINLPRWEVVPTPTGEICFAGTAVVETREKGDILMKELQIGDHVKVDADGRYEPVYSFGHYAPSASGRFLRIVTATAVLDVSRDHMLQVSKTKFVPAKTIRVDDELVSAHDQSMTVLRIEDVNLPGVFAPFTPSGKIVVSGIVASSYVAFQDSDFGFTAVPTISISQQWMAHAMVFPRRLLCYHVNQCPAEEYAESGIAIWVQLPLLLVRSMFQRSPPLRYCILATCLPLAFLFTVMEWVARNPVICSTTLSIIVAWCVFLRRNRKFA